MRLAALALAAGFALVAPLRGAEAGGGPETTLVVVNADSPTSLRVANDYVRRRGIPATHVVAVEGTPSIGIVSVDVFRDRLWKPVRAWLDANDPYDRVDTVAWSADFPFGVDFSADKAKLPGPPVTPIASLTGMTFLARHVETRDADGYLSMASNGYYRRYADEANAVARRALTPAEAAAKDEAERAVFGHRWADAAKAYEGYLSTAKDDYVGWYNYACCLARLVRLDEAVVALGNSVAAGYDDAPHAREDDDLAPLRDRADFKALLAKMEEANRALLARTTAVQPTRAFTAAAGWVGDDAPAYGEPTDSPTRHRLSVLLGYTGPFGNSAPEVLACLERAAACDGTRPDGTVYLCRNDDVRSTTREPRFETCVDALKAMGRKAEVLRAGDAKQTGVLPVGKDDVVGAVVGSAGFSWAECRSRMLPGAIAEHLTSFGAAFDNGGQTKCSELIRFGAAGSSGTVHEPYAIPMKFPAPHIHVHYAAGCSLAEAFYQSVYGPYQLLVVGDPLARPFARFGRVALATPVTSAPWSGGVAVGALATPADGASFERVELWVDGRFVAEAPAGTPVPWDTTKEEDGAHEVRLVGVEASLVATRTGSNPSWVTVKNGTTSPPAISGPKSVALDGAVTLSGHAPGAKEVQVLSGSRVLATAPTSGDAWKATVPAAALGLGEVALQARAVTTTGTATRGTPIIVKVEPPTAAATPRKAPKPAPKTAAGLVATWKDALGKSGEAVVTSLGGLGGVPLSKQLEGKWQGTPKSLSLAGEVEVKTAGLWQLDVEASGSLQVLVDGKPAFDAPKASRERMSFVLVALDAGWHALEIRLVPDGSWDVSVLLAGEQVAAPLAPAQLRHSVK